MLPETECWAGLIASTLPRIASVRSDLKISTARSRSELCRTDSVSREACVADCALDVCWEGKKFRVMCSHLNPCIYTRSNSAMPHLSSLAWLPHAHAQILCHSFRTSPQSVALSSSRFDVCVWVCPCTRRARKCH